MKEILEKYKPKKSLAFFPSKLAGISLPVSKPKTHFFEKENGRDALVIESGSWRNPKSKKKEHIGLPYGIIPRHILAFLSQEYHRNKKGNDNPRIIQFPTTIPLFLEKLGYEKSGSNYKRIYEQTLKLFNARIAIYQTGNNYYLKKENTIAEQVALWWDPKGQKQSIFNSMVEISKMTEELIKQVLPLELDTIRKIGGNCLEFDIYSWLNYRHYALTKPFTISWQVLHKQFGVQYKNLKQFKPEIKKAFNNVLELYEHNSKLTENGILLQNSKTDILPKKQSEQKRLHKIQEGVKGRKKEHKEWYKKQPEYNHPNPFKKLF